MDTQRFTIDFSHGDLEEVQQHHVVRPLRGRKQEGETLTSRRCRSAPPDGYTERDGSTVLFTLLTPDSQNDPVPYYR